MKHHRIIILNSFLALQHYVKLYQIKISHHLIHKKKIHFKEHGKSLRHLQIDVALLCVLPKLLLFCFPNLLMEFQYISQPSNLSFISIK